jgi:hypothetical protein
MAHHGTHPPLDRLTLHERTIREHHHDCQDGLPENSNRIKNPDDWITGDEEITGAQESYLQTLAEEAHENVEPDLTKAEASKEIDRLRAKTGRGRRTAAKSVPKPSRRAS